MRARLISKSFARKAIQAAFAAPSTGGAVRRRRTCPSRTPSRRSRLARGWMRRRMRVPVAVAVMASIAQTLLKGERESGGGGEGERKKHLAFSPPRSLAPSFLNVLDRDRGLQSALWLAARLPSSSRAGRRFPGHAYL